MPKLSEEKMQQRRMMIMKAAFDLFADKGYSATSMRDIMEAANVSKGGIYVHFSGKADILLSIIDMHDQRRDDFLERQTDKSAEEKLRKYLSDRLKAFQLEGTRKWARIILEFWSLPNVIPNLQKLDDERYLFFAGTVEAMIKEGIQAGEFRSDCPAEDAAYLFISMVNGVGVMSGSMGRVITDRQIEESVMMFIHYLKG